MSGFDVLASQLGVKVNLGNMGDTVYPPVPASPSLSEESDLGADWVHIYTPIKRDEIRLLILNPGSGDEPISCFLENYPVAKPKRFAALSYVWGIDTPETRRQILLDGCPVSVTANLYAFLSQHREDDLCSVLWVDAVCINQKDLAERASQIHLMKRVYESAEEIIIWLGESNAAIDAAVDRMHDIYNTWWTPILKRTGSAHRSLATITDSDIEHLLRGSVADSGADVWRTGIQEIMSRPWWSRIWVYQEATAPCAAGARVRIGPHDISFDTVLTVNQIMRSIAWRGHSDPLFSLDGNRAGNPAAYMQTYAALRKRHQASGRSRFLRMPDLLYALRRFDATNPRDKLYALIPTSLDGAELLHVAYDWPVEKVYTDAAWSMIRAHGNLDVLGHCSAPSPDDGVDMPALPSWVPNWTAKSTAIPFFKRGLASHLPSAPKESDAHGVHLDDAGVEIGKLYHASGDSVAEVSLDTDGTTLTCAGFVFDSVANVSPEAGRDILGVDVAQSWADWLQTVSGASSISQADLARILVADCDRVAIDVGIRRRGQTNNISPADVDNLHDRHRRGYYMDITGPHPASFRRRLVVTKNGHVGIAAEHVRPGDLVTILMGGQIPMILREEQQHYRFISEAFIHGIMDGEATMKGSGGDMKRQFSIR
ncbi:heterokaryon incompatibility protein-domain-containing protein [Echria macrotheca]|uniref:Heterokaryon incompatibility protein-domain-containing protein n=1 Tax=Echria macrotheca TaxID=438768 RepID=A0AAJ0F1E3_9PEZI|nr:heterokaryon incompatibility protein-domain-containing protein [Echria macrotheca]